MLKAALKTAADVGTGVGVDRIVGRSTWRKQRLVILCYHGISVADEHEWNPLLFVSQATFARRMRLLAENGCTVLRLDEALDRLGRGDLPHRAVALTFDDGYADWVTFTGPLLRDVGMGATVYLTTSRCYHNQPVPRPALAYVLWKGSNRVLAGAGIPGLSDTSYALGLAQDRARVTSLVSDAAVGLQVTAAERDEIVRGVAERLGVDYDGLAARRILTLLNPGEVTRLSAEGVDFQLHTHSHASPEDPERFREDVLKNRDKIEALTHVRPTHFCYPSGICRPVYPRVLSEIGVRSATTTHQRIASAASDPLQLPRFVDTNTTTDAEFSAWLQGLSPWLLQFR
jgi:peptidoglycan/xylan/chitin deacetylase (PgdA/CDA1 family)